MTLPSGVDASCRGCSRRTRPRCAACAGRSVSTRDGGIAAQCSPVNTIIATSSTMMTPTTIAQRRSAAAATACARVRRAGAASRRSLHRSSRQVDEEIEGEVDRDHDGGRDAGDRERARRPAAHDFVDLAVFAVRSSSLGRASRSCLLIPAAACAARWPAPASPACRCCPRRRGCRSRRPRPRRRSGCARTAACRAAADSSACPAGSRR